MAKKTKPSEAELAALAEIEQQEAKQRAQFEAELLQARESKLKVIQLKAERSTLSHQINEANSRISAIDREIGKLTGKAVVVSVGVKTGERFRPKGEELTEAANLIGEKFKSQWGKKNEVSRKDIADVLGDRWKNHIPKVIEAWNKAHPQEKIGTNGKAKALSRYIMH